jgi:hypothetical protein
VPLIANVKQKAITKVILGTLSILSNLSKEKDLRKLRGRLIRYLNYATDITGIV